MLLEKEVCYGSGNDAENEQVILSVVVQGRAVLTCSERYIGACIYIS